MRSYPVLSPLNKKLLIVVVGLFIAEAILSSLGFSMMPYLTLTNLGLNKGFIFQLLTYPFLELGLMGLLFNGLLLWFIGSELEFSWGSVFYAKFLAFNSLFVALIFAVSIFVFSESSKVWQLFGMNPWTYGLLVAYALKFGDRPMTFMLLFPMPAKYFCLLLAAINLYTSLMSPSGAVALMNLLAMVFSFVYLMKLSAKMKQQSFVQVMGQSLGMDLKSKKKVFKKKSNLRLVDDDEPKDKDPRFWQ